MPCTFHLFLKESGDGQPGGGGAILSWLGGGGGGSEEVLIYIAEEYINQHMIDDTGNGGGWYMYVYQHVNNYSHAFLQAMEVTVIYLSWHC